MKSVIKNYLIALLVILVFAFISSLILAFIAMNNLLSDKTLSILSCSISYIMFAITGYILGIKNKKNGLIHGILFSLMFLDA